MRWCTLPSMQALPLLLWACGTLVALGAPPVVYLLWRRHWRRLPATGALTRGPAPDHALLDAAVARFAEAWGERFGTEPETRQLLLEWKRGDYFTREGVTQKSTGQPLQMRGYMVSPKHVVMARRGEVSLGRTALFHELAHAFLGQEGVGLMDEDHESWRDEHWVIVAEYKELFA